MAVVAVVVLIGVRALGGFPMLEDGNAASALESEFRRAHAVIWGIAVAYICGDLLDGKDVIVLWPFRTGRAPPGRRGSISHFS